MIHMHPAASCRVLSGVFYRATQHHGPHSVTFAALCDRNFVAATYEPPTRFSAEM